MAFDQPKEDKSFSKTWVRVAAVLFALAFIAAGITFLAWRPSKDSDAYYQIGPEYSTSGQHAKDFGDGLYHLELINISGVFGDQNQYAKIFVCQRYAFGKKSRPIFDLIQKRRTWKSLHNLLFAFKRVRLPLAQSLPRDTNILILTPWHYGPPLETQIEKFRTENWLSRYWNKVANDDDYVFIQVGNNKEEFIESAVELDISKD